MQRYLGAAFPELALSRSMQRDLPDRAPEPAPSGAIHQGARPPPKLCLTRHNQAMHHVVQCIAPRAQPSPGLGTLRHAALHQIGLDRAWRYLGAAFPEPVRPRQTGRHIVPYTTLHECAFPELVPCSATLMQVSQSPDLAPCRPISARPPPDLAPRSAMQRCTCVAFHNPPCSEFLRHSATQHHVTGISRPPLYIPSRAIWRLPARTLCDLL